MVGLVNQRIAAFEQMARMESVEANTLPVPKFFVGKLISFYEHEVPTKVGQAALNAQVVEPVGEASKAPTTPSESSSYMTARSHFEKDGFDHDGPRSEASQNRGTQEIVPSADEDEDYRLRRSRFIFHINAPATNLSEAIARAQRGRGLPRARFYLERGMKIIQDSTKTGPEGSSGKEESQHSRDRKPSVKNTAGFKIFSRATASTDPSTSVVTPAMSENGDDDRIGLSVKIAEGKRNAGKANESSPAGSSSKQHSQHSGGEKSPVENVRSVLKITKTSGGTPSPENTENVRKHAEADVKRPPATNTGSVRKTIKKEGDKSGQGNTGGVRNMIKAEGRKCFPVSTTRVRKSTKTQQSTSTVTPTRSEVGDDDGITVGREGGRRRKSLLWRLHAHLRARRERKTRSQQSIVVHQLSRRVSINTTTTIPIEVNLPYPRDATEPANSFAATIHLKVTLTRDNE